VRGRVWPDRSDISYSHRTSRRGATSYTGMTSPPHEFLFSVTLYRDGAIRIDGHGRRHALPDILRMIALSIENGATVLGEWTSDEE
jgi:hypothetical protein